MLERTVTVLLAIYVAARTRILNLWDGVNERRRQLHASPSLGAHTLEYVIIAAVMVAGAAAIAAVVMSRANSEADKIAN
jgi:hypothetical protein